MSNDGPPGFVVDASVSLKWVLPEPHAAESGHLRAAQEAGAITLHVPELWLVEVGNALWARTRRGGPLRLTRQDARRALAALGSAGLRRHGHGQLAPLSIVLACDTGITLYDATYLALAVREESPRVTADERLVANVRKAGLTDYVFALRDVGRTLVNVSAGTEG